MAKIMQRVGNLFPTLCSFSNLYSAWRKTRLGSRKTNESAAFLFHLENELLGLRNQLLDGNWKPAPFHFFDIHDPKQRTIAVAPFRDRVLHHALVNVLEPVWERRFITDSFATRKGKGVHAAVGRAQMFLREYPWFLKTDVEKFFDSIHQQTLLELLERHIKDKQVLQIAELIIRHGGINGIGVPIGNRTSQFFANVYLHPLDLWLKQHHRLKGYVRYMDDFVLFHQDKKHLKSLKYETQNFLREKLQLELKPSATFLNSRQNGLSFLGTRIFPGLIRLRNENLRRITRRIAVKEKWYAEGKLSETEFLHSMNSYWAMLQFYQSNGLRRDLLGCYLDE
jgi:RNA-directed DNA polymerase